jgi:hypothetical protein
MAISFSSGTLTITGTETIATVYSASVSNSWNIIARTGDGSLGSQYVFSGFTNFDIGDGTASTLFSVEDAILRFTGLSRMRVRSNAVFRCGNLLNNNATKPCAVYVALGEDFFYTEGTGAYRQYGGLFYALTRIGREGSAVQGSWEFQNVDLKLGDSITKSLLIIRSSYLHDSTGVAIKLSDPSSILPKAIIANSTFAFQPLTEGTYTLADLTLTNIIVDAIFNSVSASTLIFVNPSKLNFTFQGNTGNTAFVRFRFDLNVKNAGSNLQNVRVFIKDGQAGSAFNGLTASNGSITQQFLTYRRWTGTNVSTVTDFSAHTVTARRYGFVESAFPVIADRDNVFGLSAVVYAFTSLSESAALAITGVAIDYGSRIITLSGAASLSSVHDFLYARACDTTGIQHEIPLVFSSPTAAASNYSWVLPAPMTGSTAVITLASGRNITLSAAGNYSGNKFGVSVTGVVTVAAGATNLTGWTFASGATINVSSGSAIVTVDSLTGITAGSGVTLQLVQPILTLTGFPAGSQVIISQAGVQRALVNDQNPPYAYTKRAADSPFHDIVINATGYKPFRLTVDLNGDTAVPVSLIAESSAQVVDANLAAFGRLMSSNAKVRALITQALGVAGLVDEATILQIGAWRTAAHKTAWNAVVVHASITVPTGGEIAAWSALVVSTGVSGISFNGTTGAY